MGLPVSHRALDNTASLLGRRIVLPSLRDVCCRDDFTSDMSMRFHRKLSFWAACVGTALFTACGSSGGNSDAGQPQFQLSVSTTGTGTGAVTSSPLGIDCGSDCDESYALNTSVMLLAVPGTGSQFSGWASPGCGGTDTCTITMSAAATAVATFNTRGGGGAGSIGLSVTVEGQGSVTSAPNTINCGTAALTCDVTLAANTTVTLTATPATGFRFAGWSGTDCTGTGSCNISISRLHGVGASFLPDSNGRFVARPYLFKADEIRLRASIAAGDPEAIGSIDNNAGPPVAFLNLAQAAKANRSSYRDVSTWNLAFAGWLLNDTAMLQLAHDEAMALIGTSTGDTGQSTDFQHVESRLLEVAATVDLAFSQFSQADLNKVAVWVNGTLSNWNSKNVSFWPNDEPRNNYWQNGFLAHVIGGIATEGFNSQAASWRTKAEQMAVKFKTAMTAPAWSGPMQSEGHYYAGYVSNALWAMELYDAAMGTAWVTDSTFSPADQLDLVMFQTRPHLVKFFSVGSETNNSLATHTGVSLSHWHHLAHSGRYSTQAQHAKSVLTIAEADNGNIWSRDDKSFTSFYWNLRRIPAAALDTKTDRLLVTPSPGAGLIGIRSSAGFQTGARAAMVFANQFNFDPAYSHSNPDAPGFQWASGSDWLVTDPDYFGNSGILAEAGSAYLSDLSNIVTLAGQKFNGSGAQPLINFARDNTAQAVPHYYIQINAANYWTSASTYRRDYVWLDDLQVVAIFDRIVGVPVKTWRLHVPAQPAINGRTASFTIGGKTVAVRDLLATGNGAWAMQPLKPAVTQRDVWRLSQNDASNDYRSLKVLDVGSRVSSASLVSGSGSYQAQLVIGGVTRTITFYDSGAQATVQ
jgi:Divergent InlB B-repeat domain